MSAERDAAYMATVNADIEHRAAIRLVGELTVIQRQLTPNAPMKVRQSISSAADWAIQWESECKFTVNEAQEAWEKVR